MSSSFPTTTCFRGSIGQLHGTPILEIGKQASSVAKQLSFLRLGDESSPQACFAGSLLDELRPSASFICSFRWQIWSLEASISLDYRGADTQLVWWGKLSPSASQPWITFSQLQASTGVDLQAPGSFPGAGSLTAKSIQRSTGSLRKSLVQLLRLASLSRRSLRTQLRSNQWQLQELRAHQL